MGEATATSDTALLREVRVKLLHLHRVLLENERKSFERTHGRVNGGELLQLVINHPQFAWLRTISALITQIDEMFDADEPRADEHVTNLVIQAQQLFSSPGDEAFRDRYQQALQQQPDVVIAHAALMALLR